MMTLEVGAGASSTSQINGQTVLSNFDIAAVVGRQAAEDRDFPITVTGGNINITFVSVVDNALVNAIQVTAN